LFAGLDWLGRERLLQVMADAGVLWLQLTGGEPLIPRIVPALLVERARKAGRGGTIVDRRLCQLIEQTRRFGYARDTQCALAVSDGLFVPG
jgi:hypothetical protein